ncbi:MAG TPA: S41 family peptidase [Bryobacteraceae bacterium]|nr:S41 family peptidase [Bryobacteraceae bacterium]
MTPGLAFKTVTALLVPIALFAQRPYLTEPHMAPDRAEIAFGSGGDIWRVAANGGEASLLVSHPAEESRPLYSPDGTRLAFVSTRTGGGDIYLFTLATGELRRLTFEDGLEQLDAWSRDGQWLYYHSSARDIANMNDVYRIRSDGGTPMPVAADRYASEFFAAPSPDGRIVAMNARGIASRQWWRKGHSHLDQSEIYLVRPGVSPSYERLTDGAAKEIWPMWAADSKSIFFISDRTGSEQIWRQLIGGTSRQISAVKEGRVLWPTLSYDGKYILFEHDFGIWKFDTANNKMAQVPIHLRGASSTPATSHLSLNRNFDGLAVSPDGKKLAFAAHGEVFASSSKTAGQAQRISNTPALESHLSWSPESRNLVYTSERDGVPHLFLYDFEKQTETRITASSESDAAPHFSPDGKQIAYLRGGSGLWLFDVENKQEKLLSPGATGRTPFVSQKALAWSPDGRWLAFASRGTKGFSNILVVPSAGGAAQPVSFLANSNTRTVAWSPDGTYLLFDTSQRTEDSRIARVDLIPRTPRFREDQFRELFKPDVPAKTETKPVQIVFEDIRRRLSFLPLGMDVGDFQLSADGKLLLVTAATAGQRNLHTYSLEEPANEQAVARQLTSSAGPKSGAQFATGTRDVYYLERGQILIASLDSRTSKPLAITAELDIDFQKEKNEVFQQAWTYQRDHFFDEKYNGANWDALKRLYEPLIAASRTSPEVYRLLNLMHGELNASHLGISAPPPGPGQSTLGNLGVRFDSLEYEKNGRLLIAEVLPLGPAALAEIKIGDALSEVDGKAITAAANLHELLQHTSGKRVELTVSGRKVAVLPVTTAVEKTFLYRAWVEDRRAYVEKISGGRFGYVHMPDMSEESLSHLYIDLDAGNHSREGVVIDIRNNRGGFVNAYALDVFARKPYLAFQQRGRSPVGARSALGQRALELPTVLVTNQHSLSDAEDFSEGYRRLKLGRVVGEPTAGWIVYTSNQSLVDGSLLRLPRTKVLDNDGALMEMHPRPVDVPIQRPVGESYTGKDVQLDAAVRELQQQLDSGRAKGVISGEGVR